ncbi:hypothetical protein PHSC3_002046 [Chlamydiales bacterium STE3]|nr:hypothetical protein PHSC3_002046 [Chlamydiales bacterium STE3]
MFFLYQMPRFGRLIKGRLIPLFKAQNTPFVKNSSYYRLLAFSPAPAENCLHWKQEA